MTNAILQLSTINLQRDLLDHININDVLERFRTTFNRLDDLKKVRDRHEQRNFFGRLFNSGELKNAQLDAQEVQAEFSKTLAQLMVITTLQSQKLLDQQKLLHRQQEDLKDNARSLADHNAKLEQQQTDILTQASEIQKLLDGLLKVNGLTEGHAEVLIRIAEDVSNSKQELIDQVEQHTREVHAGLQQVGADHAAQLQVQAQVNQKRFDQFAAHLQSLREEGQGEHRRAQTQWLERQAALEVSVQESAANLQQTFGQQLAQTVAEHTKLLEIETARRVDETDALRVALANLQVQHTDGESRLHRQLNRLILVLCLITAGCAGAIAFSYFRPSTSAKPQVPVVSGHTAVTGVLNAQSAGEASVTGR